MNGIDLTLLPKRYVPNGDFAKGGFGSVFFCEDKHLERKIAIKTIFNIAEKSRLKDEINALLSMRSKNVVQVFDLVQFDTENIGIVLEYIDGCDLLTSDYPKESTDNYLKTLWQLASGISDIHEAGIIHRDIKPNNMKLDAEGILKIFDFGLSRDEGADAATVGFKGTYCFAAPELFSYDEVNFTNAIDVYAFGAVALNLSGVDFPNELKACPPQPLVSNPFPQYLSKSYPVLISLFEQCFDQTPINRPKIQEIRKEIEHHLLKGKHQALAVMDGKTYYLNTDKTRVKLSLTDVGALDIYYDDLRFYLNNISGEVYMNNVLVTSKMELIRSCVITLGGPDRKNQRSHITFDVSNPEVAL
jgi:serine/threonine-protein kinase